MQLLPSSAAIAGGEAELTPEQSAEVAQIRIRQAELAGLIQSHPWIATAPNRYEADAAASSAARP